MEKLFVSIKDGTAKRLNVYASPGMIGVIQCGSREPQIIKVKKAAIDGNIFAGEGTRTPTRCESRQILSLSWVLKNVVIIGFFEMKN